MPTWLPAEARAEWKRIASELERLGLLSQLDRAVMSAFVIAWTQMKDASAQIARDGLVVEGYRNAPRRHPAAGVLFAAMQTLRGLGNELGLSPLARQRMSLPEAPPEPEPSWLD